MLIDIHVHVCRARHAGIARANGTRYPTPDELIATMDAHGIDKALCMGTVNPAYRYTLVAAEELVEIAAEYLERLIPCCPMDPRWMLNDPASDFRPMMEAYKHAGCRCIGEYIPNMFVAYLFDYFNRINPT